MSFNCWFKGIKVPFYSFWSLLSFYQGCWRTRRLGISCVRNWRIWWSWRKGVKIYHNGRSSNILGGLLWRTSRPVTVFLNCQITRISRVSAFRFKEFYWTWNHPLQFIINYILIHAGQMYTKLLVWSLKIFIGMNFSEYKTD